MITLYTLVQENDRGTQQYFVELLSTECMHHSNNAVYIRLL